MYKKIIRKVRVQTIHLKTSSLHDLTPANLSVIVAPHPDDEVFGCCGLMQRLIALGKRVELIIMTGGGKSHAGCCDIDENELIRYSKKGDLMMKLGTDFTDGFICKAVVDDEIMLKVLYEHMLNLMKYELCCFFIAEENGIELAPPLDKTED